MVPPHDKTEVDCEKCDDHKILLDRAKHVPGLVNWMNRSKGIFWTISLVFLFFLGLMFTYVHNTKTEQNEKQVAHEKLFKEQQQEMMRQVELIKSAVTSIERSIAVMSSTISRTEKDTDKERAYLLSEMNSIKSQLARRDGK